MPAHKKNNFLTDKVLLFQYFIHVNLCFYMVFILYCLCLYLFPLALLIAAGTNKWLLTLWSFSPALTENIYLPFTIVLTCLTIWVKMFPLTFLITCVWKGFGRKKIILDFDTFHWNLIFNFQPNFKIFNVLEKGAVQNELHS